MAKIEVTSLQPRIANDEVVVVDIQTALFLDGEDSTRVPSISFEVQTAVGKATAISSENGFCEIKDLPIGLVLHEGSELPEYQDGSLSLVATYSERGETKKIVQKVKVDIARQIQELLGIKKAKQDREAEQKQRANDEVKRKNAEEERLRIAHARYEALEPEKKRQIKGSITEAGRRIMETERFEVDAFNALREYGDHPHAKVTALAAAKAMPKRFIDAVGIYKSASWAGEAMGIATKELPEYAVSLVENFEDMLWAIDILKIAAKRHAKEVINAMPKYASQPWCYELMMHLAELAPQAVFETAEIWEYYPWAKEVALKAASRAPEFVVKNYPLYQHQPWAREVYEKVTSLDENGSAENAEFQRQLKKEIQNSANAITSNNPANNEHFAFLYEHRYHPQTRELMLDVCRRTRIACASAIGIYKSAPWAREVMIDIASDAIYGSEVSMKVVENYIEMPWAGEIMRIAAAHQPKVAIHLLSKYAAKGWAKTVMLDIAKKFPAEILSEIEYIEFQSWAGEVVAEASKSVSYSEMSLVLRKCKSQPWMTPVMQGIRAREISEQQVLSKAEKEKKAASEGATARKVEAARLRKERDEVWEKEAKEAEVKRRKGLLRKVGGIAAVIAGMAWAGIAGYRVYDERRHEEWQKKYDEDERSRKVDERDRKNARFGELLNWGGINLSEIRESPERILTDDIRTILTFGNVKHILDTLNIQHTFEKKSVGVYKNDLPNIAPMLTGFLMEQFRNCEIPYTVKGVRIGDGIVTVELVTSPSDKNIISLRSNIEDLSREVSWKEREYNDTPTYLADNVSNELIKVKAAYERKKAELDEMERCGSPLYEVQEGVDNWMIIKIDMEKMRNDKVLEGEIAVKQSAIRPIEETVKFRFEGGKWYVDHMAKIQYSAESYESKVIHDTAGQAAIREERRKRAVEKVLNAK